MCKGAIGRVSRRLRCGRAGPTARPATGCPMRGSMRHPPQAARKPRGLQRGPPGVAPDGFGFEWDRSPLADDADRVARDTRGSRTRAFFGRARHLQHSSASLFPSRAVPDAVIREAFPVVRDTRTARARRDSGQARRPDPVRGRRAPIRRRARRRVRVRVALTSRKARPPACPGRSGLPLQGRIATIRRFPWCLPGPLVQCEPAPAMACRAARDPAPDSPHGPPPPAPADSGPVAACRQPS